MKPTYRTIAKISDRASRRGLHRFPNTDYHLQGGQALVSSAAPEIATILPSIASSEFRKWSMAQVAGVNASDSRAEAVMFCLIIAIAVAGPLALLWITLANYWF